MLVVQATLINRRTSPFTLVVSALVLVNMAAIGHTGCAEVIAAGLPSWFVNKLVQICNYFVPQCVPPPHIDQPATPIAPERELPPGADPNAETIRLDGFLDLDVPAAQGPFDSGHHFSAALLSP
ncbi:hypothetical protein F4861DRAFT_551482 [Xylaria intraflava]|nr:hypothetical protein F4861DRAFT_551482 [Xylaria intraflava]